MANGTQIPANENEASKAPKPIHPLLVQYDAALHSITEKFRKDHPEFWFWYSKAYIKPLNPQGQGSVQHQTEIVRPGPR